MADLTLRAALLLMAACLAFLAPTVQAGVPRQDIPSSYERVAENDQFELYVDSATLAFKVVDRRSDYVWHSGIDELIEGDRLNRSWQAFARSGLSIEYFDNRAVSNRVSLASAEHTLQVAPIENGVAGQVTFVEYGITLELLVQLEADGVRVELPFAAIREDDPNFRLGQVQLYPFLGATRGGSVPGYMVLPDGTGSLVRFADTTRARNMFYGRYYGPDLGVIAYQPYNPRVITASPISYPVFGMVHGEGQHAFLSVVERGAAYGELQAHPAGIITNFNFLYNAFVYNQTYFQATNRSGAGVTTVQAQPNAFDAVVHYRFLTGEQADYVGLAHSYQRYLLDHNLLRRNDYPNPAIGMRLEFLGGDKEPSLLGSRFVPMTTLAQMGEILAGLQIANPEVILYGWQPYGATSMPPATLTLESGLGGLDELNALAGQIAGGGGHFSLYLDPQAALWNEPGYSARNDLAMAITDVNIEGYSRFPTYYFTLDALRQRYPPLAASVAAHSNTGLALDGIGSMLYGDYRGGQQLDREAAIAAYQSLLAGTPVRLGFYRPNDYAYFLAEAYYDMPLGDNGYIYTTEAVPFLPIVLAGYVPYYGGPLNFSSNRQNDLLQHVEYGIYPSYFLTSAPTSDMLNTPSAWTFYTSSYAQWGEQIRDTYAWMNALLGPVRGQEIVAHEQLDRDVYATTYANGRQIIVNYGDRPFMRGALTVEPNDAVLLESSL